MFVCMCASDALKLQFVEAGVPEALSEMIRKLQGDSDPHDLCSIKIASNLIVTLLLGGKLCCHYIPHISVTVVLTTVFNIEAYINRLCFPRALLANEHGKHTKQIADFLHVLSCSVSTVLKCHQHPYPWFIGWDYILYSV